MALLIHGGGKCFSTFVNGGVASGQRLRHGSKTADAAGLFGLHRSNITRLLARATEYQGPATVRFS